VISFFLFFFSSARRGRGAKSRRAAVPARSLDRSIDRRRRFPLSIAARVSRSLFPFISLDEHNAATLPRPFFVEEKTHTRTFARLSRFLKGGDRQQNKKPILSQSAKSVMAAQHAGAEGALDAGALASAAAAAAVAGRLRSSKRVAASSTAAGAPPTPTPGPGRPPAAASPSGGGPATPAPAALARPRRGRSGGAGADAGADDPNKRRRLAHGGGGGSSGLGPFPPARPAAAAAGLSAKLGCGRPLRLIVLGHNPSEAAWRAGHFYAHGSNKMWPLLRRVGVSPPGTPPGPAADDLLPLTAGVGFLDVGTGFPGTHSSAFSSRDFARWRPLFYARLRAHVARASALLSSAEAGAAAAQEDGREGGGAGGGQGAGGGGCACGECGAPLAVAFAGKRQFQELLALPPMLGAEAEAAAAAVKREEEGEEDGARGAAAVGAAGGGGGGGAGAMAAAAPAVKRETNDETPAGNKRQGKKAAKGAGIKGAGNNSLPPVALGLQTVLPRGWPLPQSTQVWVTATTSGAAGLTDSAREASWREMWAAVGSAPWPRAAAAAACRARGAGCGAAGVKKEEGGGGGGA